MADFSSKEMLKKYGIFSAFIAIFFLILFLLTLFSRSSWNDGLQKQTQTVIDSYAEKLYVVTSPVHIDSPFATSAACFSIRNRKTEQTGYAVILRMMTIYGPIPGVFVWEPGESAHFIGFACLSDRVSQHLQKNLPNSRIQYWQKRISQIVGSVGEKNE